MTCHIETLLQPLIRDFSREELLILLRALELIVEVRERRVRLQKLMGSLPASPSLH